MLPTLMIMDQTSETLINHPVKCFLFLFCQVVDLPFWPLEELYFLGLGVTEVAADGG